MENKDFRTYRRRKVTRESGNKASGTISGGEAKIICGTPLYLNEGKSTLEIILEDVELVELFQREQSIIAFGGYIISTENIKINLSIEYYLKSNLITEKKESVNIEKENWSGFGMHITQQLSSIESEKLNKVIARINFEATEKTLINLLGIDFKPIDYIDYFSDDLHKAFNQKTNMHIPHIYYLSAEKKLDEFIVNMDGILAADNSLKRYILLKGCNRCTRFLPINTVNEQSTLSFSLHCKKKAPCKHSIFSNYTIINSELVEASGLGEKDTFKSYYGHQLECKSCKKYYVNHALNPLRNAQQFKEDGLRRRAMEILTNTLLDKNLIHHEFEYKNKKEFTEFIWEKFDKRCFKCSKKLKINEMHLDHTMPLAYLYRLDESATCLCPEHNSQKSDHFPVEFYTEDELLSLSLKTELDINVLKSKKPNMEVVELLEKNIVWFFDVFLMDDEYQKIRDERLTADKIYAALERILKGTDVNLIDCYMKEEGIYPSSISLKK